MTDQKIKFKLTLEFNNHEELFKILPTIHKHLIDLTKITRPQQIRLRQRKTTHKYLKGQNRITVMSGTPLLHLSIGSAATNFHISCDVELNNPELYEVCDKMHEIWVKNTIKRKHNDRLLKGG